MATASEVKSGLDKIAGVIQSCRLKLSDAKENIKKQKANLDNLPTTYAGILSEINGYLPSGAMETLAKDELSKLTAEYQELLSEINALNTWITDNITEF